MPYKDADDRRANFRLWTLVRRNERYRRQGFEPVNPDKKMSLVRCTTCGRVSKHNGHNRHWLECPRRNVPYHGRRIAV